MSRGLLRCSFRSLAMLVTAACLLIGHRCRENHYVEMELSKLRSAGAALSVTPATWRLPPRLQSVRLAPNPSARTRFVYPQFVKQPESVTESTWKWVFRQRSLRSLDLEGVRCDVVLSGLPQLKRVRLGDEFIGTLVLRSLPSLTKLESEGCCLNEVVLDDLPSLRYLQATTLGRRMLYHSCGFGGPPEPIPDCVVASSERFKLRVANCPGLARADFVRFPMDDWTHDGALDKLTVLRVIGEFSKEAAAYSPSPNDAVGWLEFPALKEVIAFPLDREAIAPAVLKEYATRAIRLETVSISD